MGFTNPYPASRLTVDSTNSLVTGMQLWFPFTTGTGTSAQCILHAYHTGTLQSGASWASSDIGTVLELDGNSEVDFTTDISRNKTAVSCSAWIKPDIVSGTHFVFYEENGVQSYKTRFGLIIQGGAVRCGGRDDDGDNFTVFADSNTSIVATGVWQHVVAVFDPTGGGCKVYLDGVDVTASSDNTGDGFPNTASLNQVIGGIGSNSSFMFDGQIQNLRVYDRALSAAEVATLYHRPWEGSNYGDIWPYSPPAAGSMTLSSDAAATSLMTNCVGWWPLTTGTGTTAKDIVGTNDGTLTNVDWLDSELGMSSDFQTESNGDHITTSFSAAGQSEITVSFWMRNDGGATPNTYGRLLSMGFLNALDCYINKSSNNALSFVVNSTNVYFSSLPPIGEWFHFCGVWSQSSRQELYINGSQVATGAADTSVIGSGSHNVIIGGTTSGPRTFHGGIQNVRIWDRALSSSEVALLAERPWEGIEYGDTFHYDPPAPASMLPLTSDSINTNQVGWWPLTETDDYASGAADISGNSKTLTKVGTVVSAVSRLGGTADFDGSGDYLQNTTVTTSAFPWTLSAWGYYSGDGTSTDTLLSLGCSTSDTPYCFIFFNNTAGTAGGATRCSATGWPTQTITSSITAGNWYHLVWVQNSQTSSELYVNGASVGTDTTNLNSAPTPALDQVQAGILDRTTASNDMLGRVQNCRLWSKALTADEVWSIYSNPWLGSNYKLASGSTPLYNYIFRTERFRRLA